VRRLAMQGMVWIGYNSRADAAQRLAEDIDPQGGRTAIAQVDVRDDASVSRFLAEAQRQSGRLDAVISVTGPAIPLCPLTDVSVQEFRRILETDVIGAFNVLQQGIAALKPIGGGAIILFLTAAVLRTLDNDGMSGIPKTAVAGLLRQAAREAGPHNIRVNGIAPGVIDAGIVHSSFTVSEMAQSVITACLTQTPMPRMGRPEEVAALAAFLASTEAGYINGQIIGIDGGYSA
jgi:3-oxoacyl-[acyl-carrier protein] reductase